MMSTCGGGSWGGGGGGLHLLAEQEGILCVCGEGHLLDGMVQEGGGGGGVPMWKCSI